MIAFLRQPIAEPLALPIHCYFDTLGVGWRPWLCDDTAPLMKSKTGANRNGRNRQFLTAQDWTAHQKFWLNRAAKRSKHIVTMNSVEPHSCVSLRRWNLRVSERLAYVGFCRTFSADVHNRGIFKKNTCGNSIRRDTV